ncbi:hypothetical protein H3T96_06620 [Gilliamella sp. W8136]|uniref:Uncharacterized protein n=1 Tax=Gilliamella apicola TaxID=1196095 RepID=A0A556SCK2_9GAMM|nr:hypothetical protein [Gilliamella sp. W8136]MBI0095071.1 hypothetical protein [Gilliamella sp. W8136]TSJ98876.1 hypothetical protein FPQ15_06895 [Gilliamella apicola]
MKWFDLVLSAYPAAKKQSNKLSLKKTKGALSDFLKINDNLIIKLPKKFQKCGIEQRFRTYVLVE